MRTKDHFADLVITVVYCIFHWFFLTIVFLLFMCEKVNTCSSFKYGNFILLVTQDPKARPKYMPSETSKILTCSPEVPVPTSEPAPCNPSYDTTVTHTSEFLRISAHMHTNTQFYIHRDSLKSFITESLDH